MNVRESMAPVVLFVYARLGHTMKTIQALLANDCASETDLIVYSDAPKDESAVSHVSSVREYIRSVSGFKSVTIFERNVNFGLAKNIVDGVGAVVEKYGQVIVLEDDIVTSPKFLLFMNRALEIYSADRRVWHISGWNYPIDPAGLGDVFLWRAMNCWGWATWKDRWEKFEKNPERLIRTWNRDKKMSFDLEDSGVFWSQIERNLSGELNSWAIFWYATIFENNGLCLNPSVSYVYNIGNDGSGVNCGRTNIYSPLSVNLKATFKTSVEVKESSLAVSRIRHFYKLQERSLLSRVMARFNRIVLSWKNGE